VLLRTVSEHPYHLAMEEEFATQHVRGSFLERFCIAPLNINYHIAHHLFPATPFYRLPQVHRRLLQSAVYREQADSYENYLGPIDSIRAKLIRT